MALDRVFEGIFDDENQLKTSLISILPKVNGDMNDPETLQYAFGLKINEIKTKTEQKKLVAFINRRLKELKLVLKRIVKDNREIVDFDDSVKIMKTQVMVPLYELYDYDGKLLLRSNKIEVGYSGAYYYYDMRSDEFVAIGFDIESKSIKETLRSKTENDLLLAFERKDKGIRFGFKKVPNIPKDFKYDEDESKE